MKMYVEQRLDFQENKLSHLEHRLKRLEELSGKMINSTIHAMEMFEADAQRGLQKLTVEKRELKKQRRTVKPKPLKRVRTIKRKK